MFKTPLAAAALLGLALTSAPAFAAEQTEVKVAYADLDLTTPEGQRTLERRLDTAARKACGYGSVTTGSRLRSTQSDACFKQARSKAKEMMASATGNGRLGG